MYSKSLFTALLIIIHVTAHAQSNKALTQKIDSIFQIYEGKPGLALAVVKHGETLFQKGYGLSNLANDIPITPQTIFEASAVAKQITAACIFLLEREGKLSLDDPLAQYFPDLPEYPEGELTLKHLVYQTSGIRSYLAILFSQNQYFGNRMENEDVIKLLTNQRNLNFSPGTRQNFSHSNYVLLSEIIEKASGEKLSEYAQKKIFTPLNMSNTFFIDRPDKVIKNGAIAYLEESDNQFVHDHFFNSAVVGDGGLYTNVEDLIRWSNNLSTGMIGGKELIDKMITPGKLNSGVATHYGGGIYNQNHYDIEGLPSIRHAGVTAGFRSLYYKFLKQDIAFIILSNNANTNVWAHLDQLTSLFLADEIAEAQRLAAANVVASRPDKAVKLKKKQKRQFLGSYYNTINGSLRTIALVDDQLQYQRVPNAPGSPLSITSSNELILEAMPFVKMTFGQDHNSMIFTVNDQDPIPFERYESRTYSPAALKEFENSFYNEDLDVTYQVKSIENQLQILVDGKELVVLTPFVQDMFREEHFGYIKFHRDSAGIITGFTRTDDNMANLDFQVLPGTSL